MDNIPEGYRITEIGVIPENWEVKRFIDLFNISAGRDLQKNDFSRTRSSNNYFPIYSNSLENKGLYGFTKSPRYKKGTITVTARGTIGKANPRFEDYDAIGRLLVLDPKCKADINYLSECINHKVKFSIESTGVPQLTAPQISNYSLPFPKVEEQELISVTLSDIDSLITSFEKLIGKKKMIKQGVMQELLTGKMRLAGFSGEWIVANYLDLFNKVSIRNKQLDSSFYSEIGKFPIVDQGSDLIIAYTNDKSKVLQCPSDGLIIFGDHTRYIKYINFDFVIGADGVQVLECKPNLSTKFVYYAMQLFKIPNTGYNRHFKYLKEVELEIPSDVVEQTTIATFLTNLDLEIEILKSKLSKLKQIKQGAMQQLLTGKIRLINK